MASDDDDIPLEKLWSAHDRLFRHVFSKVQHARGMLRRVLPAEQVADLDWSSLCRLPGRYVDDVLAYGESDLVFAITSRSAGLLLFYLLVEHQNRQQRLMVLRMLGYAGRCLADQVGRQPDTEPIPRLIPVVMFQGPRPWTAPRRLSELCQPSPGIHERVELEMIVHELSVEDAEILAATRTLSAMARAALVMMKLVAARADLQAHAALLGQLLREVRLAEGAVGLRPLLVYLLHTRSGERDLRAIMKVTDVRTRVIVQTAYEKMMAKGEARGRAEGEARGRAEGEARGRAEGEARGRAEGEARGRAEMFVHFVRARFGVVSPEVVARIRHARVEQLDRWAQRLLTAATVDEMFID